MVYTVHFHVFLDCFIVATYFQNTLFSFCLYHFAIISLTEPTASTGEGDRAPRHMRGPQPSRDAGNPGSLHQRDRGLRGHQRDLL